MVIAMVCREEMCYCSMGCGDVGYKEDGCISMVACSSLLCSYGGGDRGVVAPDGVSSWEGSGSWPAGSVGWLMRSAEHTTRCIP